MSALLEARGVEVRFGGVTALAGVDFEAHPAAITGLIGPNGAGKSTLFNVLSGLVRPLGGTVWFAGQDMTEWPAHKRARAGIARTFQRPQLLERLSVRDNLMAGWEAAQGWAVMRPGAEAKGWAKVDRTLERLGLGWLADRSADGLPTGQARLVELARALVTEPRLLLLDEPGAGLDPDETEDLGRRLRQAVNEDGLGVVLVEHDMSLVMQVCDRVTVLESGSRIADGTPEEVRRDPLVVTAYLGESDAA
jgi:branched-chain amino acid transport system ATP-binding protein